MLSPTERHTAPWMSPRERAPLSLMAAETPRIFSRRALALSLRLPEAKRRERQAQRPASTHETGLLTSWKAPTRMVRFSTRFCLAPTSSSPSTSRMSRSDLLRNSSSGTEPPSEISVTSARPASSASSSRT